MATQEEIKTKFTKDFLCFCRIMFHLFFTFDNTGSGKISTNSILTMMYWFWIHILGQSKKTILDNEKTAEDLLRTGIESSLKPSKDIKTWDEVKKEIINNANKNPIAAIINVLEDTEYVEFNSYDLFDIDIIDFFNNTILKECKDEDNKSYSSYGYISNTYSNIYVVLLYLLALKEERFQNQSALILKRLFFVLTNGRTKDVFIDKSYYVDLKELNHTKDNLENKINKVSGHAQELNIALFNLSKHFYEIAIQSEKPECLGKNNIDKLESYICRAIFFALECDIDRDREDDLENKFFASYKVNSILRKMFTYEAIRDY